MQIARSKTAAATTAPIRRWSVFIAGVLVILAVGGSRMGYSVFIEPLASHFGWNRAAAALPYSLMVLGWGFSQPIMGRLIDFYGPKKIIFISSMLGAVALFVAATVTQLWQLSLVFVLLLGVSTAGSTTTAFNMLLAPYFSDRQRAKVFATNLATVPGSVLLFAPMAFAIITRWGWRQAFLALGLMVVLCLPVILAFLRDHPETKARVQEQAGKKMHLGVFLRQMVADAHQSLSFRPFRYIFLAYFSCGFASFFFLGHIAALTTSVGFTPAQGATAAALSGVVGAAGAFIFGALADRYYRANILSLTYLSRALGFLLLANFTTDNISVFYLLILVAGLPIYGGGAITNTMVYEMFRDRGAGMLMGLVFTMHQIGGFIGVFAGGLFFDLFGGYGLILWLTSAVLIVSTILSYRAGRMLRTVGGRAA
ncbi:MAG: MFS transporter [Firmicutes bacterium]|nr:MFS transporter [Bacillota bacterium]